MVLPQKSIYKIFFIKYYEVISGIIGNQQCKISLQQIRRSFQYAGGMKMKRIIAIFMAALMLTGVLTACSGTVGMDEGRSYGNVSTTPNGNVNGYGPYDHGNGGANNYNGSTGRQNSSNGQYGSSYNSGTGMTGGR